jgi:hypothetical protein
MASMGSVRLALAAAYEFAWKCGVIVIAVALLPTIIPWEADEPDPGPRGRDTGSDVALIGGEARVSMTPPAGEDSSSCTLVDEDGRPLLRATYRRDGGLKIRWGDAYPVQPYCSATLDGWLHFIVAEGVNRYEVMLHPTGASGVRAFDVHNGDYHGLGYTKQGDLVVNPWDVGRTPDQ